jgi:hypothetical protein
MNKHVSFVHLEKKCTMFWKRMKICCLILLLQKWLFNIHPTFLSFLHLLMCMHCLGHLQPLPPNFLKLFLCVMSTLYTVERCIHDFLYEFSKIRSRKYNSKFLNKLLKPKRDYVAVSYHANI